VHVRRIGVHRGADDQSRLAVRIHPFPEELHARLQDEVARETLRDELELVALGPHVRARGRQRVVLRQRVVGRGACDLRRPDVGRGVEVANRSRGFDAADKRGCRNTGYGAQDDDRGRAHGQQSRSEPSQKSRRCRADDRRLRASAATMMKPHLAPFAENVALGDEVKVSMVTDAQKSLVQNSFAAVATIADDAAVFFYQRLFELDPSLRPLFRGDMAEQRRKLMQMLTAAVKGLDRLDQLVPVVKDLGRRHSGYGVVDKHYETVGEALLWTLEVGLGRAFTPEGKEAWVAVYPLLATTMKDAAREALVGV